MNGDCRAWMTSLFLTHDFYPRDTMLVWYLLSSSVHVFLSVHSSVTSRYFIRTLNVNSQNNAARLPRDSSLTTRKISTGARNAGGVGKNCVFWPVDTSLAQTPCRRKFVRPLLWTVRCYQQHWWWLKIVDHGYGPADHMFDSLNDFNDFADFYNWEQIAIFNDFVALINV